MVRKNRRCAIYVRISDDKEGRSLGVARQEKDCRALAEREGLEVVDVYEDNDVSASANSRKRRPGWDRMLDDAEAGAFGVIVAYSTSRLTRRPGEREELIELHAEHGVSPVFVVSGRPDLSTADGRQTFRLLGTVDTGEAERTAERARRKQQELAEAGRHNGPRPYGYRIVGTGADARLEVDYAEAAIVRECVARVLRGEGIWSVTNDLNARGVPSSTGKTWSTQVLRRMLLRPTNAGMRQHQPRRRGKPHGAPTRHKGQWEPIVDAETFQRLEALLSDPARRTNNRGTAAKYLLTSVARCGACGGHLAGANEWTTTLKNGRTRTYPHRYRCQNAGCMAVTRKMADVDEHVERVVLGVLERDGVALLGGDPVAAAAARERIAALEAKLSLAADQFADDVITLEQMSRINGRVRPQVEAERARLAAALPATDLADFAGGGVRKAWARADVETRKRIIRAMGVEITVHPVGPGNGADYDPDRVTIV